MAKKKSTRKSQMHWCPACHGQGRLIESRIGDFRAICENKDCPRKPRTEWRETRSRAVYDWNNGLFVEKPVPVLFENLTNMGAA